MAEKRGHLEKMVYDFPTEAVLEVCIKGKWYRVTSREFRSYDGKRRITKPVKPQGRGEIFNIPMKTEEYNGPVFMWGTNNYVPYKGTHTYVDSDTCQYFQKQFNKHQSGSYVKY